MCVVGPMAGTVADLTISYRLMARPDASDALQSSFAPSIPPSPSAKKYIGICVPWLAAATAPVTQTVDPFLSHLISASGYERVDISIPYLSTLQLAHAATCLTEAADGARSRVPPSEKKRDWLSLVGPANRILLSTGSQTPAADFLSYARLRTLLMRHLAHLFELYPGLVVASPTAPIAGWPRAGGDDAYGFTDGNTSMFNMTFAWLANTSGCPAVTCPVGYVEPQQGEGKLPVGVMGMAEWGGEESCLAFAREVEGYVNGVLPGGRRRPGEWADVIGLAKGGKGKVDGTDGTNGKDVVENGV